MSQTDKGVLIFFEWFEAMSHLDPKTYKSMMTAIYNCQLHGTKPPEFKGKADILASIIFPCIERRIALSKAGKKGAQRRGASYGINPIIDDLLSARASREASGVPSSEASSEASSDASIKASSEACG